MGQVIQYFISGIFLGIYFLYIGSKFFGEKLPKSFKLILTGLLLMIFITANYMWLDNFLKTAALYLAVLITYRIVFRKNILQCAISSFLTITFLAIGEVIFIILVSSLEFTGIISDLTFLMGAVISNLAISIFAVSLGLIIYKPVNKFIGKIREHSKVTLVITFFLLLAAMSSLFYKIYFHDIKFDIYLIFNLFLVLTLAYIAYIIIKQYYDKIKLGEEYKKYVEYSKQSEKLVNQYSISQHENKNELIIIRSMVHRNNKKLIEYLNEIISTKDNINDGWIRYLQYLPFGGLKGIIHNKICEMKENNIKVFLNISKNIVNSQLKDLTVKENAQLLKIIGVFLDNAKDAAIISVEKEVSICIYFDDGKIFFEISNTYNSEVDLSKINIAGITTKGKGRGYGLALVESLIRENKIFINETKKKDNYFVQTLKILKK